MEGLTEEEQEAAEAAEAARVEAEGGVPLSEYVVQKLSIDGDEPMWTDLETVQIPRKAPRKHALQVVLEGMGADPDTGVNEDAAGKYRVIPARLAEPIPVSAKVESRMVIG